MDFVTRNDCRFLEECAMGTTCKVSFNDARVLKRGENFRVALAERNIIGFWLCRERGVVGEVVCLVTTVDLMLDSYAVRADSGKSFSKF